VISAFWAGQEGTFLFWVFMTSIMGWIFLRATKNEDGYAMSVVSGFSAFLYILMLVKNPFETTTTIPADGSGLNPLLQDPWMAIHPPILFLGYAATTFPFALVISGLARRNYERWFSSGFSWTLFASLALGAGIIIGGFWAYEVLGWGGYWGWDPVENSSLVPWITLLILTHGLVVQKSKGSLVRTNIFFAIVSFVLVIYATFLTRSGILANFSVHSFEDLGINNYLIGGMVLSIVLGIGLFLTRFGGIKYPKVDLSNINREMTLLLSLYVLGASALFIFVGMSSPIITGLFGKASQVDTTFYNKVNLPVAIVMALLLGITPFLGWTEEKKSGLLKRLSMSLALTALACIISYVAGVTSVLLLLFVGSSVFGLISNVIIVFRQYRSGLLTIGGPISHIGVTLLLIGIIGSGKFDESTKTILKQGEPQSIYGYQFTFQGITNPEALKPLVNIEVSDGKSSFIANPKLYYSEYNKAMMREPDIKVLPLKDLYISPLELKSFKSEHAHNPAYEITKGETKDIGGYQMSFVRFDMGQHQTGGMAVGAVLNVTVNGKTQEVIPQLTFNERGERKPIPADLPTLNQMGSYAAKPQIALTAISVEEKKIMLELLGFSQHIGTPQVQELVVDISIKPLMMVVWTGVVLIMVGTLIAWRRRMLQKAE
jgi:cytochrome c-type biogenesis protein CcmF